MAKMLSFLLISTNLLISCTASRPAFDYPVPTSQEDCMRLFTDVLSMQRQRNAAADQMSAYTDRINAGKMSVRKYRKKYSEWKAIENRLRGHVTHIYDAGYEAGCFDEEKVWTD